LERLRSSQHIYIDSAIKSLSDMDNKRRALAPVKTSSFKVGDLVLSDDNKHTSLESAAITDYADMYIIDHIVKVHPKNFMGKSVKISNLKFKVRWVGYGAEGDTYQAWGTLRKTPQFRAFIENHPNKGYRELSKYLPQLEGSDDEETQII
jgi:hypothetical protein